MTKGSISQKKGVVIAIDGPAGTGKSSATRRLAEALGFVHIDTGALYRAIAWVILESRAPLTPEKATEVARQSHLEFRRAPGLNPVNRVLIDGRDVTSFIRSPEVNMAASQISAFPGVRAALLGLQRRMGCLGHAILEGRDIGTVIFPDADLKFFLSASVEERAKRRLAELEASGSDTPSFEEVKRQISERDTADATRAVAPLKRPEDAIDVDTSRMTLDEVVAKMEQIARASLKIPQR